MALQTLITFASWEERFQLGVQRLLDGGGIGEVFMIHCSEYQSWTAKSRQSVADHAARTGIRVNEIELSLSMPEKSWKEINTFVDGISTDSLVDITTMPREVIVFVFDALRARKRAISYHYAAPQSYSSSWLSRDPGKPRVIIGRGGISYFEKKTLLCVSVGYDIERVLHLVNFYEPIKVVALFQSQDNLELRGDLISRFCGVSVDFSVVNFIDGDRGLKDVQTALAGYHEAHNIMLASLGPKTSAVTFYEISCLWPSITLVYAPSNEYNREYSTGIGRVMTGLVQDSGESTAYLLD